MYDPDTPINFRCLAEECPNSCCGPFVGFQQLTAAMRKSDLGAARGENDDGFLDNEAQTIFTLIRLSDADVKRLLNNGLGDMIVRRGTRDEPLYFLRLKKDGSCKAFGENGRCTIYGARPTVCRAFPFYIDMFGGLATIASCPGVGAGRSKLKDHEAEIAAVRELYTLWLETLGLDNADRK